MLKRPITYTDFDENKITEVFYFHLSKAEIVELEVSYQDSMEAALKRIIASNDRAKLVAEFKKLILLSYGVKSADGKRFIKTDEAAKEFAQTAAYDALFMELATDANAAAIFVKGILPKDLTQQPQDKPVGPPLPPSTKQ
jgi:hypothetical protein